VAANSTTTAAAAPATAPTPADTPATAFNALPLLEHFGGAPGMVTASRVRPLNATVDTDFDDEDREEWLYDYR